MILKNCKQCGEKLEKTGIRCDIKKFCNNTCRGKFYYKSYNRNEEQREKSGRKAKGKLQCQICGRWYVQVCSHVTQRHNMNAKEYKEFIGQDVRKGIIPEWYRDEKRKANLENKEVVWGNFKKGEPFKFRKGNSSVGKYKRSEETMERLRQQSFIKKSL